MKLWLNKVSYLTTVKGKNFLFSLSGFQFSLENKAAIVPGHRKYLDGCELILIGHRAAMTVRDVALCITTQWLEVILSNQDQILYTLLVAVIIIV